jgi:hypothetical protein
MWTAIIQPVDCTQPPVAGIITLRSFIAAAAGMLVQFDVSGSRFCMTEEDFYRVRNHPGKWFPAQRHGDDAPGRWKVAVISEMSCDDQGLFLQLDFAARGTIQPGADEERACDLCRCPG